MRFALLDAGEELAAFGATVVDKGFDILLQTGYRLLHLRVELLSAIEAGYEVVEALVDPPILCHDGSPLSRESLVFTLLGSDALVFQ